MPCLGELTLGVMYTVETCIALVFAVGDVKILMILLKNTAGLSFTLSPGNIVLEDIIGITTVYIINPQNEEMVTQSTTVILSYR